MHVSAKAAECKVEDESCRKVLAWYFVCSLSYESVAYCSAAA